MDTVSGSYIGVAPGSTSTATPTGSSKLGKDEFLKLLMAQMANQDPTAPTDSQAFVAQLAQFANVELLQGADSTLQQLLVAQASANQTGAATFVGRDITYKTDQVVLGDSSTASVGAHLDTGAHTVTAVVTDASGKTIRTLRLNDQPAGDLNIQWDGMDDNGLRVPAGSYTVKVTAADASNKSIGVDQHQQAHVTGVSYAKGYPELIISNGQHIPLSAVEELKQAA